jgi:hypothetical protein
MKIMFNNKSNINEIQLYGIYIVVLLYASGTFIGIYDLGWQVFIPLLFIFSFFGFFKFKDEIEAHISNQYRSVDLFQSAKKYNLFYFLISPVFIYLFLTWNQEFPFVGDHDFHLRQEYYSSSFWINFKWQNLLLLFSFILSARFNAIKYWIPLAGILLIWWSRYDTLPWHQISHAFYIRYPALAYFLSTPFMYLAALADVDKMYNYSRTLNVFALFVWVAVIRPFFLKRKPDISFALFCLFFLFQPNVIYYFNTNYLEPLASIPLLIAIESLFVFRQSNAYVIACLLVGLAAMVKEQAILVLPWVWLAGKPWTWKTTKQWARGGIVGISSVLPFFIYYLIRMQRMDSGRNFKLITLDQWIDPERYSTLFGRIGYHLGGYGIAAMSLMLILSVIAIVQSKEHRTAILCILCAALTQIVFFFADANSSSYVGYFRFAFIAVALITGIALSTDIIIKGQLFLLKIGCAIIFIAALYNLFLFFTRISENDMNRNFTEHSDAPIFLPISSLIEKAESQHLLRKGDVIHIADNTGYHINSASLHYTKIATTYSLDIDKLFQCSCYQDADAVIVPFVYFSGMNAGLRESPPKPSPFAAPPQKMAESWFVSNEKKDQCYNEMKSSCDAVVAEKFNGEVVGLLGVKKRP